MKIVCFGSLNVDMVYYVDEFVRPGQTISSYRMERYPGGKGLNQVIAAKRAEAVVLYAGSTGYDGKFLLDYLKSNSIDTDHIKKSGQPSGHAVIQVNKKGENSIIVNPGANYDFDEEYVDEIFTHIAPGDIILLQNEINLNGYIISKAGEKNLYVVFNPSPFSREILKYELEHISCFVLNEDEGNAFTGKKDHMEILERMAVDFPKAEIVLTLGKKGSVVKNDSGIFHFGIFEAPVNDTTGAGDTFTGYYLAGKLSGSDVKECMKLASAAAALCVSKKGAATSIPLLIEVEEFIRRYKKNI